MKDTLIMLLDIAKEGHSYHVTRHNKRRKEGRKEEQYEIKHIKSEKKQTWDSW